MMAADAADALAALAATPRLLVALDFDGTLSPLTDVPMSARMLPASREAIDALLAVPDTWVGLVSGRSLGDLRIIAEHDDDSRILLAGSHGAEFWYPGEGVVTPSDSPADAALRDRLRADAERLATGFENAWIEPKTFGFGLHTRTSPAEVEQAAQAAMDALVADEAPHWRRRRGLHIVEYAFRQEGKDAGVAALRAHVEATAVLFAGDEGTDEDALERLGADDVGVHVGAPPTAATVLVPDIPALAALLLGLAAERTATRE